VVAGQAVLVTTAAAEAVAKAIAASSTVATTRTQIRYCRLECQQDLPNPVISRKLDGVGCGQGKHILALLRGEKQAVAVDEL
jgi:hypothetical protein